jgi:UDP-3-O-[3-hydroxymyristoyl] glucosamine N-acyltransferase
MGLTLEALSAAAGARLRGDAAKQVVRVATLEDADADAISFLANKRYKPLLQNTRAGAVVLLPEDADDCPTNCLISDNPYLAHARILALLHPEVRPPPGVDPGSFVDPGARIAADAHVAPNCYIGDGVVIGDGAIIGPNCVVFDGVEIGAGSRLVASVTLGSGTRLGERCLIHPGTVIGADGFGLANDDGRWVKVAQIGRVVLGDDVEVGACCSIDRGAIGDTVLEDGVKLDDQVHVAHNVRIGAHTAIAGCVGIAGSTTIGAYCTVAGAAAITGHVTLADHVHVSGMTAITRSIHEPGLYTATVPSMPHATWMKNFARLRKLDDMARKLQKLEKEIAVLRAAGPPDP